ncbi:MAG: MFS transporter [Bryobacterales bacterium]|nr:MFS transporter [Bryobacteraceae bacterium]MDW8129462.1 MFS transporter [Bryobacterales bacterium]
MRQGGARLWLAAALLAGASALNFLDRQALSVLAPVITVELAMSNADYGRAVSAFTLAYSVMFAGAGRLIDRVGTRLGLGLSVAFWSLASALHALARSGAELAFFRALLGVGEGGCFPGVARAVVETFPERQRALIMGISTTGASALGAVVAPPLIAWSAAVLGWRGTFLATGLLGALWVAAWFLFLYPPARGKDRKAGAARQPAARFPLRWLLAHRTVWGLALTRFLLDPAVYIYMFWIPQYLNRERGASLEDIGRLAWIPFFTLGVSSCLGGAASDALLRRGWPAVRARKLIMGMAALLTPISILAVWAPSAFGAVLLFGVLLLAHGFWMTNYMTLTTDVVPAGAVASVVGLAGMAGGVAGFAANLGAGHIVDALGFAPVFVACGLLYPVGYLVVLSFVHPVPARAA